MKPQNPVRYKMSVTPPLDSEDNYTIHNFPSFWKALEFAEKIVDSEELSDIRENTSNDPR